MDKRKKKNHPELVTPWLEQWRSSITFVKERAYINIPIQEEQTETSSIQLATAWAEIPYDVSVEGASSELPAAVYRLTAIQDTLESAPDFLVLYD